MIKLELFRLKSMWGNYLFNYACSMARGRSGGLISLWDPNMFAKEDIWCDDAFVIVKGQRKILDGDYFMINIYGPHDSSAKAILWNRIADFMQHHNEMNKAGTKLSKLDRFLFSKNAIEALPDAQVTALDRLWSDHNPILLHCNKFDYGPTPFRLYHSWFNHEGFDDFISTKWNSFGHNSNNQNLLSHEKLKCLKAKIKVWIGVTKTNERHQKQEVLVALKNLEAKIDSNTTSLEDRETRIKLLHEVDKIDNFEALDLHQKSRIKWDIEGDENSKFFHGLVNQKRRTNSIQGIMSDGTWITNLQLVKETSSDLELLEKDVSLEEIKSAI
ncbi:RNA-directed DNA polymerase, eukaryota, reverse transcriptase zinc-binding domain protein [Tanacetum coccineum]